METTTKNEKPVPLRAVALLTAQNMRTWASRVAGIEFLNARVCVFEWADRLMHAALHEPTEDPELRDTMLDYKRRLENLTTLCERRGLRVGFGKHGEVTLEDAVSGARAFAIKAHGDQKYSDEPYIGHLDHVVSILREYGFQSADLIDAAYLHDVLEDTEITYDNLLESGFSALTCQLVQAVTDEPGKNRRERKAATYPKIAGWTDATILKLADRIANSRRASEPGKETYMKMYAKEYAAFRRALYRDTPATIRMWVALDALMQASPDGETPQAEQENL